MYLSKSGFFKVSHMAPLGVISCKRGHNFRLTLDVLDLTVKSKKRSQVLKLVTLELILDIMQKCQKFRGP